MSNSVKYANSVYTQSEEEKRYLVKMRDLETGFNLLNRHKTEITGSFQVKTEVLPIKINVHSCQKESLEKMVGAGCLIARYLRY